jgi:Flp pilus assembly protein TadG
MALYRNSNRSTLRRAIAAVELAALAPLLGTIIVGMVELSRGMMAKETLSNAARKGCRTAIQRDKSSTDAYNDAVNIMTDNGYTSTDNPPLFNPQSPGGTTTGTITGNITIIVKDPADNTLTDALNAPSGSSISVQVGIPASSVNWVTSFFLQGQMIESETVVMMKQ